MQDSDFLKWNVSKLKIEYRKVILSEQIVRNSGDLFRLFVTFWDKGAIELREDFAVLLFDTQNQMIGYNKLFSGGIDRMHVDIKLIYSVALAANASAIAVAHNHPSGNVLPSPNDHHLTRDLCNGCEVLRIKMLDHLIISPTKYFSFADEGYI